MTLDEVKRRSAMVAGIGSFQYELWRLRRCQELGSYFLAISVSCHHC